MSHVLTFPWEPGISTPVTVDRIDERVWVRLVDPDPESPCLPGAFPVPQEWLTEVQPL